jgi:ribosomal protein S18 acetylase RimI-like enzyme
VQKAKRNNAEVVIRELRDPDYDALTALWREASLPYKAKGRDTREAIARQLQERTAVYLLAEADGIIVGAVLGTHDGRKGWINRLAVLPAYRRRRVGAQLLAEAERRLAALGIKIFACLVEDWNGESKNFFEKSGYKPFREVSYYTKRKNGDV